MSNKLSLLVNFIAVDKMSGALRNFVGLGRDGSKSLKGLNGEARKLSGELAKVEKAIAKGTGNLTALIDRERELKTALQSTNQQLEKQKRLAEIEAGRRAMVRRGDELMAKGQGNMIGGAAMSAPLILAAKAAMDFSSGMVDIQQKAELSNAETAKMADNIILLARAAHQLPEAMRGSVDVLSGFGLDPRQALQMIGPIGRLGTAFKVDLSDGAAAAYANLNNLKVPISETAKALDIMAAGGNAGAFEVKDMARWFPTLTAQLQALGQKGTPAVADLTAALQVAMNTAGSADEAANNIANLLGKVNAKATATAFQKNFGIDLPAAIKAGVAKGQTTMEAFAEVAKKATKGDLSKLGWGVEDRQAQMGLLALIQNLDKYRQIRAQISSGSGGTVDRAFAQREAQDASIAWATFMGTAQELAITLGSRVLPSATGFLRQTNRIIIAVSDWARRNPALAGALANVAVALVGARIGLGALQFAFGGLLGPAARFLTFFQKVDGISKFGIVLGRFANVAIGAGGMAVRAFGLIRTAMLFMAQGVMRAGAMMLANPIVLIITAIVAAVGVAAYLIYTHWDKISATFRSGVQWVKNAIAGLPDWLRGIGSAMMQGLLSMIDPFGLRNRLLDVARNGVNAFKAFFGIKSPSRLFMAMGGHLTSGLALGVAGGAPDAVRAMSRMATNVAKAGAQQLTPLQPGRNRLDGLTPIAPAAGSAASMASLLTRLMGADKARDIILNIYGAAGQDVKELAKAVLRELEKLAGVKARSSFEGDR